MDENIKKSFDFAADITKQLITLSTAIITLSVAFAKDIVPDSSSYSKSLLIWCWAIFILSIVFGILTLMALTGTLTLQVQDISINKRNIRFLSLSQIGLFIVALILTAIFGVSSIKLRFDLLSYLIHLLFFLI